MSWLSKLKSGLSKSSAKISAGIENIFIKKKLDEDSAQELEDLLISADLGVETSKYLVKELINKYRFHKEVSKEEIKQTLTDLIIPILEPLSGKEISFSKKPHVVVMAGVNGGGKTTTIAKLAKFYQETGKKVMFAACDTFRAAAVDQLAVWADRLKIPIVIGEDNSDPASVAYKATKEARDSNIDLLLIDTAGRLHNKEDLMAEFSKIVKVIGKIDNSIIPEVILVLDSTTGQNAIAQLEKFQSVVKINGLIVTKLDGTAKGGILVSIAKKFNIPILSIGIGEGLDDLQQFSAKAFAENLLKEEN